MYQSFDYRVDLHLVRVRIYLEKKYGTGPNLIGKSQEAANILEFRLKNLGFTKVRSVEGFVTLDKCDKNGNIYCKHTWVEVIFGMYTYYLDVAADQFNNYMKNPYPDIICCKGLPNGVSYTLHQGG